VNEIKENSKVILKYLMKEDNVTLSELERKTKLSKGQARIAVAYLLGAGEIEEFKVGMAKLINLK